MAVGFMGVSQRSKPNRVGSLMLVCAPWRKASYTQSWSSLFHLGTTAPNDALVSLYKQGVGHLRDALVSMYELRQRGTEDDTYLHPISMQLCPPNYALYGWRALYREKAFAAGEPPPPAGTKVHELVGIETVKCRRVIPAAPLEDPPTTLEVPLSLDSPLLRSSPWNLGSEQLFDGYRFAGEVYSVEQRIGENVENSQPWMAKSRVNPKGCEQDASNNTQEGIFSLEQSCSGVQLVGGIHLVVENDGRIVRLYPGCVNPPE
ncbi:MAG: hypothetical protein RBU37_23460 [Myxococcota bacterium]|jgi:hypothetical protein|nr:hypothetical protein [Myxococcota bacterium]